MTRMSYLLSGVAAIAHPDILLLDTSIGVPRIHTVHNKPEEHMNDIPKIDLKVGDIYRAYGGYFVVEKDNGGGSHEARLLLKDGSPSRSPESRVTVRGTRAVVYRPGDKMVWCRLRKFTKGKRTFTPEDTDYSFPTWAAQAWAHVDGHGAALMPERMVPENLRIWTIP
jgi:hypothetical protein